MERIADYLKRQPAVYGGAEPDAHRIARTFRYWRRAGKPAAEALAKARADDRGRFPSELAAGIGAPFQSGSTTLRWVERPADIGLRFVGFADELTDSRTYGYFTEETGDGETLRGAVYQLPSRDGRPLYVAGFREGETGKNWKDWRDTSTGALNDSNGPAALAFGDLIKGTESDSDYYGSNRNHDAGRDAAHLADSIAEKAAESQREYNAAYSAGRQFADMGERAAETRQEALALLAEMKPLRRAETGTPAICSALRSQLDSLLERLERLRTKRAEILDNWSANYSWDRGLRAEMIATFNDGAGDSVVAA